MYYLNYFWLCTFLCVWMGTWCLIMIFMWIVLVAEAETTSTVEAQAVDDPPSARFTWTIDNFSRLNTKKLYSDVFFVGGYKWYLDLSICFSNYIYIPCVGLCLLTDCCDLRLIALGRRIVVFPKGNNVDHLSMYLDVADSTNLPYGWSRYAQFSLSVINQIHNKYSIRKGILSPLFSYRKLVFI